MFAIPFSQDAMDRVTGYRALALLALIGLALTAYNSSALIDHFSVDDAAATGDENAAEVSNDAAAEDDSGDSSGGQEFAAAPGSDEDPGGADGADLASGATGILAALLLALTS